MSTEGGTLQFLSYITGARYVHPSWHIEDLTNIARTRWTVSADGPGRPVRLAAHRQPLCWNFMYHSRIVLSVGRSVWCMVRNLRFTVTTDSVLAYFKTQNAFLFPILAMFRHDCPLAAKPASTPRRLVHKKTWRDSLTTDMLLSAVPVLVVAQPSSEVPEGLMNYPVVCELRNNFFVLFGWWWLLVKPKHVLVNRAIYTTIDWRVLSICDTFILLTSDARYLCSHGECDSRPRDKAMYHDVTRFLNSHCSDQLSYCWPLWFVFSEHLVTYGWAFTISLKLFTAF
jgi:hypothetical protein